MREMGDGMFGFDHLLRGGMGWVNRLGGLVREL